MRLLQSHYYYTTDVTTGMRRFVARSAQLLSRDLPGKQAGEAGAQAIRILEYVVTYLTCWYFLLLHKAHPGHLMTTTYPLSYLHLGLNPDKKYLNTDKTESFYLPYSLIYAAHLRHWHLQRGQLIFCRFWNYYLVICSEVYIILTELHCTVTGDFLWD